MGAHQLLAPRCLLDLAGSERGFVLGGGSITVSQT